MSESGDALPPIQPAPVAAAAKSRPAPRGTASYQRRRAVTACQVCRARRTKCDNLKPSCSFCLKTGATCIQSPVDLSNFDPASLKILERLDHLEDLIQNVSLESRDEQQPKRRKGATGVQSDHGHPPPAVRDVESLDQSIYLPVEANALIVSLPCFRDPSSPDAPLSETETSPGQESHAAFSTRSAAFSLASFELEVPRLNSLLDNFFAYVHVKNPIFEERVTRRLVHATFLNGLDWSPESCLSLLVCALGSISSPFGPQHEAVLPDTEAYASATLFFHAAQRRLGTLLCSDETLITAQCFFLSGVFLMCVFQETKAWRYFLQALAQCQQLSFLSPRSRRLYHSSLETGEEEEVNDFDSLHQAIYWSSWKSEREMRASTSLADFSPHDHGSALYPNFFPTPPPPREEDTSSCPSDQLQQKAWYFYLAEISLRRLAARLGDALETSLKSSSSREGFLRAVADQVPSFEEQIKEWIDSLPTFLSFREPASEDDICRFVLRGHAVNLYELIYSPFISAHLDDQALSPEALRPFISLAQAAVDYHMFRLEVNEPGYRHRHHGTAPMLRSCSRSAAVLVAVWKHNRNRQNTGTTTTAHGEGPCMLRLPAGWDGAVHRILGALDYWGTDFTKLNRFRQILGRSIAEG